MYGAGGVVATQNAASTTTQHVAWQYKDPSNASFISATHSGATLYSGDDEQAELDPLGSNVGTSNPYDTNNPPNLQEQGGFGGWGDPFGGYSCRLDGFEMPCSQVMYAMGTGIAYQCPDNICSRTVTYNRQTTIANYSVYNDGFAGYVPMNARYAGNGYITPIGFNGIPILTQSGRGTLRDTDIARLNGVRGNDERHLRETRWMYPWFLPNRALNETEVSGLYNDVKTVLNRGDCLSFIAELLNNAATVNKPNDKYLGDGIPERIVNGNVLDIFDRIRGMGGFRSAPLGGLSSIRGTLIQRTATVYLAGEFGNLPAVSAGMLPNVGGRTLSMEEAIAYSQQSAAINRAVTTIHELLHFNFSDGALAQAVAAIKKERLPSGGGLVGDSNYWSGELRKHCK